MRATRTRARARAETKQETREALVAAALAELAEHGLDAPSLDAICARAGYTRGAFYVHFRDRADLLAAVVEQAMGSFLDAVIARDDGTHDLERTVGRFADAVATALAPPRGRRASPAIPLPVGVPFARILDAVTRDPRLRARFATLLGDAIDRLADIAARGQRARTVRDDVDPAQVGLLLTAVALGVLVAIDAGLAPDPARARAAVLQLLAPPRGDRDGA
jgi:TetR/AcrR family transcriptional repressor of nem operon